MPVPPLSPATLAAHLHQAVDLALENVRSGQGGPFAALVVRDGAIIGQGVNLVTLRLDPTAHAEVLAIREAAQSLQSFDLSGSLLFTSCEPCPMCFGAIHWARLDAVYFAATRHDAARAGFDDEEIYLEIARPPDQRRLPLTHFHLPSALDPFTAWATSPAKTPY